MEKFIREDNQSKPEALHRSAAIAEVDEDALVRQNTDDGGDDSEEHEDVPHQLRDDDPKTQIRKVFQRSLLMMAAGTALVLIFSDPMVDVLSDVGARIGVSPFYISFVLAPLASNASELLASYQYACKKTSKTVTISFSTLLGAAILNNTFVLAIFMALIYLKGLAWTFTAETIAILVVEFVMYRMSQKKIMYLRDSFFVLALFPASLLIVAFLENVVGLD
jgi:Ca2+/Na+ antiporter